MRKLILLFVTILTTMSFHSCYENSVKSCYEIDIISEETNTHEIKVGHEKKIPIKFTNNCGNALKIWEVTLESDDENDFYTEGINSNSVISENGLIFNLIFQPKSTGHKKAILTIKHDLGTSVLSFNINVI